ncbi:uncharacterized protein BYT42DRAFT_489167 [Radiomyces spectabilis]|uniref:uncharacterized protein n=1 Tax=Radiomyces spectabilis TaxID=64574 RepID=UPI00221FAA6E|nr:uncharacterized protein BYT42DRAFT_489167 [Radiomyces spectabilis]KAI8391366.1 hypothetical protein BYT42DRAFT_489167 [Radiomyces spectabilis]
MSDALLHCLERLHLDDDTQLKERALRFQQQCSRLPPKVFDAGPNCKPVISIHLAFESLEKTGWDNKLAAQLATCTKAAYENTISNVRKQLNLQPTVSFNTLTIALGCTTMIKQVEALYSTFTEKYITRLSVANRQSAKEQLQQPQWKGATVYVCAKAFGVRFNCACL